MPSSPRQIALTVLNRLAGSRRTLDPILADALADADLSPRDRSLTYALVYGVLRWRGRIDWIIDYFSRIPLPRIDPPVLNILRLGVYQIVFMDRVPPSAAVNTAVELAKGCVRDHVVRFVNGILRSVGRSHAEVPFPPITSRTAPVQAIAATRSYPPWLVRRWIDRYGVAETVSRCDAENAVPPVTLRTNTLRTDRSTLVEALESAAGTVQPTALSPHGITLTGLERPVFHLPGYVNGGFGVQDEAAQLVTHLTDPQPGELILDACAGLGGKTGHLAQLMENRGRIVAIDRDGDRLAALRAEMARLGVTIVTDRVADWADGPTDLGPVDRILLDAPCSGLGVLQRHPDAKWRADPEDLPRQRDRQIRLLSTVAPLLRPGGVITYVVCSTEPEETEDVARAFLDAHPEFDPVRDSGGLPEPARRLVDSDGFFRTRPDIDGMDGFFAVRFRKILTQE